MSDILKKLESLIVGNDDFLTLKNNLNNFNMFEAIGGVRSELRHSSFLAFLLDPDKPHGLGSKFLENLLFNLSKEVDFEQEIMGKQNRFYPEDLFRQMIFEISLDGMVNVDVYREFNDIDILVQFEISGKSHRKFALIIENKVDAGLSSHQLKKYKEFSENYFGMDVEKIYFFLTKDGVAADTECGEFYIPFSYDLINQSIKYVQEQNEDLISNSMSLTLKHYQDIVGRHVLTETRDIDIARKIYNEHKDALDFILKVRDDTKGQIKAIIKDELRNVKAPLDFCRDAKTYINFCPTSWLQGELLEHSSAGGWSADKPWIQYEFNISASVVDFKLVIGAAISATLQHKAFIILMESEYFTPRSSYIEGRNFLSFNFSEVNEMKFSYKTFDEETTLRFKQYLRSIIHKINELEGFMQEQLIKSICDK